MGTGTVIEKQWTHPFEFVYKGEGFYKGDGLSWPFV